MALSPEQRSKLDSIVAKMDSQGAAPEEIRAVVEDFKTKYGAASPTGTLPGTTPGFLGGVKDAVAGAGHVLGAAYDTVAKNPNDTLGMTIGRWGKQAIEAGVEGIQNEAAQAGALMDAEGPAARGSSGRGLSAVGHGIAAAVPFVGPAAAHMVERGAHGDVSGALGEFAGTLGMGAAGAEVAGGIGSRAAGRFNRETAQGIASQGRVVGDLEPTGAGGMNATRVAAAAKNAEEIAAANKAGLDLQEWLRVDRQTPEMLTTETLGLKPKHFKEGRQPTQGAMRTGIVDKFDQTPETSFEKVTQKFDELSGKKAEALKSSEGKATPDDLMEADDLFEPILDRALKQGNKNRVRKIAILRANLLKEGTKDLTAEGIQRHLDLVKEHIGDFGGQTNASIRRGLEQYYRHLADIRDRMVPEGVPLNRDMRDLIPIKGALKDKMASEAARTPDTSTLKAPEPQELPPPAPGEGLPVGLIDRLKNMSPDEKLSIIKELGLDFLPLFGRSRRIVKTLDRAATK